jgi:tetratricopeptide (TPR) repeat protein
VNPLLGQAARLYAARDYRAAEAVCRTIVGVEPSDFDALHLLGVLLTLQARSDEAVTYLRAAQAERPDHPQMLINLGNALLAVKRYQEVLPVSQADEPGALNNLGLAYRSLDQHEAAAQAFLRATQLRWDHAPA